LKHAHRATLRTLGCIKKIHSWQPGLNVTQ
jgi:hypothetical protein